MDHLMLSWVRTAVPAAVGALATWLVARGVDVDAGDATAIAAALTAAATTVYQVVVSTVQRRWPIVGVLLGSTRTPMYVSASPRSDYHPGGHAGLDLDRM